MCVVIKDLCIYIQKPHTINLLLELHLRCFGKCLGVQLLEESHSNAYVSRAELCHVQQNTSLQKRFMGKRRSQSTIPSKRSIITLQQ